jgi:small subunit ribosomal protein S6
MRHYEAMYIVDADTPDELLEPIIEKYKKVVVDGGGEVSEAGKWEKGRRPLAYEINKKREGMYLLMQFQANPEVPKELDRIFRINDEVIRHLVVRQDSDEE